MYNPVMLIRPDDVIRSGIIQPFSVRAMDPVQYARHEIDPFVWSIRPTGPSYLPVQPTIPSGGGRNVAGEFSGFGQTEDPNTKFFFAAGGAAAGILIGFLLGRSLKKGRRR